MTSVGPQDALRSLVDRIPQPALIANDARVYIDANQAACDLLQLPRHAVLGKRIDEFVPADARDGVASHWAEFLQAGVSNGPFRLLCSDGTCRDVNFFAIANVTPGLHISFLGDITEQKRAARERQEAERLAKLALEAGRMGSWVYSVETGLVTYNERLCSVFGIDPGVPHTYESFLSRVHPDDLERVTQTVGRALSDRASYELQFRAVRPDGIIRWVADRGEPMFVDDVCIGVAGVTWDITDVKDAEEKLRLSERRFRTVIEQSPFSTQLFAPDGSTRMVNDGWKQLWAANPEDVAGYNLLQDRQLVDTGILEQVRRVFAGGQACELPEIPYRPPAGKYQGQELWIRGFLYPVKDLQGHVTEVVLVHEDVSAQRQIDAARVARDRELARSNAELQRFTYVASHDLKEPLRNVCAFSQMLQGRLKDRFNEDELEILDLIADGAKRMADLIDGLLAYSKASLHRDLVFVDADAEELLAQALRNIRVSIEQTGAVVDHEPLPSIRCSPLEIVQVMQNLLSNAIKYRGAELCRVHVKAEQNGSEWIFEVKDNGIGINPEHREQIFGLFTRLHREGYSGTGIGLAICKSVVEKHGGRIWVESQEGQGAAFRFSIPR